MKLASLTAGRVGGSGFSAKKKALAEAAASREKREAVGAFALPTGPVLATPSLLYPPFPSPAMLVVPGPMALPDFTQAMLTLMALTWVLLHLLDRKP